MTDDMNDYVDKFIKNTMHEVKLAARQTGKTQIQNYMLQQLNMTKCDIKELNFWKMYGIRKPLIIIDDPDISDRLMPEPKEKDWECKIPHHDPFARPMSSPSDKVRAKARAKRKKK